LDVLFLHKVLESSKWNEKCRPTVAQHLLNFGEIEAAGLEEMGFNPAHIRQQAASQANYHDGEGGWYGGRKQNCYHEDCNNFSDGRNKDDKIACHDHGGGCQHESFGKMLCTNWTVWGGLKGRCSGHGGGHRCSVDDCTEGGVGAMVDGKYLCKGHLMIKFPNEAEARKKKRKRNDGV
jgi:hypothetical protein